MKETSEKCNQKTCEDTPNATSSPGSAGGPTRSGSLGGLTSALSGLVARHASLSRQPESGKGKMMSGTSGQRFSSSSASAALTRSLASRLKRRSATLGSTMYKLTWSERVTPSGRLYCLLRASARRTSDSDCGLSRSGWATAKATDGSKLDCTLSAIPKRIKDRREIGLAMQARMTDTAAWDVAGWPTARANDGTGAKVPPGRQGGMALKTAVQMTGPARLTARGKILTGSSAEMGSGGRLRLNPRFSGWLMGFPESWCKAALSCQLQTPSRQRRKKAGGCCGSKATATR